MSGPLVDIRGYQFQDPSLLRQALTHPSLAGQPHYQRLEFLGDRVLGLVIADWLLMENPDAAEGLLAARFSDMVRAETLADIARTVGLLPHIRLAPSAETDGSREKASVTSDVCEAVIGAVYLDGGYDAARALIRDWWQDHIHRIPAQQKDNKTTLQEWAQGRGLSLPDYELVGRDGPDHQPAFTVSVAVEGHGRAEAVGTAKKQAEQAAAAAMLAQLRQEGGRDHD